MKNRIAIVMVLAAAALAAGAGCASKGKPEARKTAFGCPMGARPGSSMSSLIAAKAKTAGEVPDVKITEIRCSVQSDLLRVEFVLTNMASRVRRVSYRFDWVDASGFRVGDEESWKPVMLDESVSQVLVGHAPTRKAADFAIVVMDEDKPPRPDTP